MDTTGNLYPPCSIYDSGHVIDTRCVNEVVRYSGAVQRTFNPPLPDNTLAVVATGFNHRNGTLYLTSSESNAHPGAPVQVRVSEVKGLVGGSGTHVLNSWIIAAGGGLAVSGRGDVYLTNGSRVLVRHAGSST
jgi:hypothetical protein